MFGTLFHDILDFLFFAPKRRMQTDAGCSCSLLPECTMIAELPETGFLRISQIVGNRKAKPPITPLFPVSRTTWWTGVKNGRYPAPVRLSEGVTVWRAEDIRKLIDELGARP
jgi:predicted DNA-binding transcriptional regulator AlpA